MFFYSVESTALRLIMGFGSWEVQPQLSRVEPKSMLASESEEINRALILTLARAIHGTGGCHVIYSNVYFALSTGWQDHNNKVSSPPLYATTSILR